MEPLVFPQLLSPRNTGSCSLETSSLEMEKKMQERGGGDRDRPFPLPPPPKPQILRPGGVTTKFHSTDRKEIKSF